MKRRKRTIGFCQLCNTPVYDDDEYEFADVESDDADLFHLECYYPDEKEYLKARKKFYHVELSSLIEKRNS